MQQITDALKTFDMATVLVVDDDPEIRTLLFDVLVEDGYVVPTGVLHAAIRVVYHATAWPTPLRRNVQS